MFKKVRILIVEDDASISDIYSMQLQASGFEVITAVNGKEGLEKALAETPALILLDIQMPIMDGLTMLKELRPHNDYTKKVPVIMMTNLSADRADIIKTVAETGPVYYLVKVDVTPLQVVEKIKECLGMD